MVGEIEKSDGKFIYVRIVELDKTIEISVKDVLKIEFDIDQISEPPDDPDNNNDADNSEPSPDSEPDPQKNSEPEDKPVETDTENNTDSKDKEEPVSSSIPAPPPEEIPDQMAKKSILKSPFVVTTGVSMSLNLIQFSPTFSESYEQTIIFTGGIEWDPTPWAAFTADFQYFLANLNDSTTRAGGVAARFMVDFRALFQKRYVPGLSLGLGYAPVSESAWINAGLDTPAALYWYIQFEMIRFRWDHFQATALTMGFGRRFGMPTSDDGYSGSPLLFEFTLLQVGFAFNFIK